MIKLVKDKDIAFAHADIIVNAANGCGYMCGQYVKKAKTREDVPRGVSESLNYYTNGLLEKEARKVLAKTASKRLLWFPLPLSPGKFFITNSCGLDCAEVFHAVTMRFPGSRCSMKCIEPLIGQLFEYCVSKGHKSIAVPLLGCGTGRLDPADVFKVISDHADKYTDLSVEVYGKVK